MKKTTAVLTNIAYTLSGIYGITVGAIIPGLSGIILSILSGTHHYYMEDWSRKLDYLGMYLQTLSISLWLAGVGLWWNAATTVVLSLVALFLFGAERLVVGALILLAMTLFAVITGDLLAFIIVSAVLGVAFLFNQLGDGPLKKYHSWVHGYGWHILSALSVSLLYYLVNNPL